MIPPTAAAIIVFVMAMIPFLVRVLVVDRFVPGAGAKTLRATHQDVSQEETRGGEKRIVA